MRIFSLVLLSLSMALSVWTILPAPTRTLLPLGVGIPELAPWLVVLNLIVLAIAGKFARPAAVLVLVPLALSFWPLLRVAGALSSLETQGLGLHTSAPTVILDMFRPRAAENIEPEQLPMGMLLYRPRERGPRPVLVDLYGGGWQRGAPGDDRNFHVHMASRGYVVFAIDYRHAPEFRYPAQMEDVRSALDLIASHAADYHADMSRMAICGHSSGAQLALLAAFTDPKRFRAVISFYGPTNLARGYAEPPSPDPLHVRALLEDYLGGSPQQAPEKYRQASPITFAAERVPPTMLIQGERDHIVKAVFAQELKDKLQASGNRAYLLKLPWAEHAFDAVFLGLGNGIALRAVETFLKNELL